MIGDDLHQTRAGPARVLCLKNPAEINIMQIVGFEYAVTTVYCFADR